MRVLAAVPQTRRAGIALAAATACVSGIAVFVNGYGVRRWADATAYTTAKNSVAAILLGGLLVAVAGARGRSSGALRVGRGTGAGMVAVAVIGGGVPFALFFEGLARASSTDAAFLHKTLLVWVALLAVPLLHERVGLPHAGAIALLVVGQAALTGGVPDVGSGSGEAMVLAATLLWAVETVVAKRMLAGVAPVPLALARMGGGVLVLLSWLAIRGDVGALAEAGSAEWGWAVLTGVLLAAYVATWYSALARAQAVDVTAVLVLGALVTAVLDAGFRGLPAPEPVGVALILIGGALAIGMALRPRPATRGASA